MNKLIPSSPGGEFLFYQTEDGRTRIQCRFENETIWLTQALMAELFQKDVRTINEHLVNIFDEGELNREATIRKFRIVRAEGSREVTREVEHYRLEAILAVGYRVRSLRGTQFRQWATARLRACLKTPPKRRVRARGLQETADLAPFCRPGPPTGRVFKQALSEYRKFMDVQPRLVDADFEKAVKDLKKLPAPGRTKKKS